MKTREDALYYVRVTVGDYPLDYDMEAIVDDVYEQLGTYDFTILDHPDVEDGWYWDIVEKHDIT